MCNNRLKSLIQDFIKFNIGYKNNPKALHKEIIIPIRNVLQENADCKEYFCRELLIQSKTFDMFKNVVNIFVKANIVKIEEIKNVINNNKDLQMKLNNWLKGNNDLLKNNPEKVYNFFCNNAPYFFEFKPIVKDINNRILDFYKSENVKSADTESNDTNLILKIFLKFLREEKNINIKELFSKVTKDTPEKIKLLKLFLVYFKNELKNRDSLKHVYSLFKDKSPYFGEFKYYFLNYPMGNIESNEDKKLIRNLQDVFKNYESVKDKINKPKVIKPHEFAPSYGTEPVEYSYNPKYKPNRIIENIVDSVRAITMDASNIDKFIKDIGIGLENLFQTSNKCKYCDNYACNQCKYKCKCCEKLFNNYECKQCDCCLKNDFDSNNVTNRYRNYFEYDLNKFKNNVIKLKDNPSEIEKQFSEFIKDVKCRYVVAEAFKFFEEDIELHLNKLIAQKNDFLKLCRTDGNLEIFKLYYDNMHYIFMYFTHYFQKLKGLLALNNEFNSEKGYKSENLIGIIIDEIDEVNNEFNYIKQSKEIPDKKYISLNDKFFSNIESHINELYEDLSKFIESNIKPYKVLKK